MFLVNIILLIILFIILFMLIKEEKIYKRSLALGLARKFWVLKEKRKFVRFNDDINIRYNLLNKNIGIFPSKSKNISENGICFISYEKLKNNTPLEIELDIPGEKGPINLKGQVVWVRDIHSHDSQGRRLFHAGIKFYRVNKNIKDILERHMSKLTPDNIA